MTGFPMLSPFRKSQIVFATLGAVVAVSLLAFVSMTTQGLMLLGSFGASALLLFALPEAPLSQPRSVVGGHLIASSIAFACLALLGPHWWAVGLATGLGVGLMMFTRTVHPPAGSNAIIVFLAKPTCGFLVTSTVGGTVMLVAVAWLYHRTTRRHKYPLYWRAPVDAAPVTFL
ncbi:MAG TPA: HPP family protein [Rariglobus sp.]